MLTSPHYKETMAYVVYQKKQDAIDILLGLETDARWQGTLIQYGQWLENQTLSTTAMKQENTGLWLENSASNTSK